MFDYEGSRSEFLKILAEVGEEPAFIKRGLAPEIALDALIKSCSAHHDKLLEWPRRHFTILRERIAGDWSRIQRYLAQEDDVRFLIELERQLVAMGDESRSLLSTDRGALRQFIESGARFNNNWLSFVEGAGLDHVNQLREDYNQFYEVEKSCAFETERTNEGFQPLPALDSTFLLERFPILNLPELA